MPGFEKFATEYPKMEMVSFARFREVRYRISDRLQSYPMTGFEEFATEYPKGGNAILCPVSKSSLPNIQKLKRSSYVRFSIISLPNIQKMEKMSCARFEKFAAEYPKMERPSCVRFQEVRYRISKDGNGILCPVSRSLPEYPKDCKVTL